MDFLITGLPVFRPTGLSGTLNFEFRTLNRKYPRQLSAGSNNAATALSETEAAKLYVADTRSEIGSESEKMKFANGVNSLVCRFIWLDYEENL